MINSLGGNPLRTKSDMQVALRELWIPLIKYFSPGRARVKFGHTSAHFPDRTAEMEGFARPLWGLVPLSIGGYPFPYWDDYRQGLTHGSDPYHPEYWGQPGHGDQLLVEMAPVGLALALIPEIIWESLEEGAKINLAGWLGQINRLKLPNNNWLFFRVLVNLGLLRVGAGPDLEAMKSALLSLEKFYLGEGWYSDGPNGLLDYYNSFAFHYYGLIYAKIAEKIDPERSRSFRERASIFARDFIYWFSAEGSALPFGRSLTYRFAQGCFWGALAFADVEAFPWSIIKGLALRHLRWWATQPIFNNDGTLSIGYAYPNLNMAEQYNSPGSPYWAFKYFLPLALPESHPFWSAEESPLPQLSQVRVQKSGGMVLCREEKDTHIFALHGGQSGSWMRHGEAKYAKFAYSTTFAFSVPSGQRGLAQGAYDSVLALSEDGRYYRVRDQILDSRIEKDVLYSLWSPMSEVEVETWLVPFPPWHVRVHCLKTNRKLYSAEGGFATSRPEEDPLLESRRIRQGTGFALAVYPFAWSGLRDLRLQGAAPRTGQVVISNPNTNLLHPRTTIPTLIGKHRPGQHWLICAVAGARGEENWEATWKHPPDLRRESGALILAFEERLRRIPSL